MKRGSGKWSGAQLGEQSISVDVDNKAKVRLKLRPNGRERVEWSERGDNKSKSTPLFKTPVEFEWQWGGARTRPL